MGKTQRMAIAAFGFACVIGLGVYGSMDYLREQPANINFVGSNRPGQPIHIYIQTVGDMGTGLHPQWVSYLVRNPKGKWVHSTQWQVPPHTRIILTNYEFDGTGPLRNQMWARVTGVQNNTEYVNGKPYHLIVSNQATTDVAHTFSVPSLGINVPWYGVPSSATNLCDKAPCSLKYAHETDTVMFTTGKPGQYRWQCFIPCGLGYLDGNGGPMQTLGYMAGFLKVQPTANEPLQVGQ